MAVSTAAAASLATGAIELFCCLSAADKVTLQDHVLHIDKTTIDVGSRKQKHTQTKSVDQLVVNIWAKCRLYRLIVIVLRDDDNSIRHL